MNARQEQALRAIIEPDYVLDAVKENFEPEDVFDENQLVSWAENNGFVKEKSE